MCGDCQAVRNTSPSHTPPSLPTSASDMPAAGTRHGTAHLLLLPGLHAPTGGEALEGRLRLGLRHTVLTQPGKFVGGASRVHNVEPSGNTEGRSRDTHTAQWGGGGAYVSHDKLQ